MFSKKPFQVKKTLYHRHVKTGTKQCKNPLSVELWTPVLLSDIRYML